jgi:hypothetical protein
VGVNVSALMARGSLEVGRQAGRYPVAGFLPRCSGPGHSRIWVVFRPLPGRGCRRLACRRCFRAGGSTGVSGQRIPQLPVVPGVQVDLVLGAVQPEPDGTSAALPSRSSMSGICIF